MLARWESAIENDPQIPDLSLVCSQNATKAGKLLHINQKSSQPTPERSKRANQCVCNNFFEIGLRCYPKSYAGCVRKIPKLAPV